MLRVFARVLHKRHHKNNFDPYHTDIPHVVTSTINFIEDKGLETEGIFRYTAEFKKVRKKLQDFAKGKKDWDESEDPHFVASVLKAWICELEAPLLTEELHDSFLAAMNAGTFEGRMRRITKVISLLPPGNRVIFKKLVGLFEKVSKKQEINKMGARNLAIVFSPMLLRSNISNLYKLLEESEAANTTIEFCIENYYEIFFNHSSWLNQIDSSTGINSQFSFQIRKDALSLANKVEKDIKRIDLETNKQAQPNGMFDEFEHEMKPGDDPNQSGNYNHQILFSSSSSSSSNFLHLVENNTPVVANQENKPVAVRSSELERQLVNKLKEVQDCLNYLYEELKEIDAFQLNSISNDAQANQNVNDIFDNQLQQQLREIDKNLNEIEKLNLEKINMNDLINIPTPAISPSHFLPDFCFEEEETLRKLEQEEHQLLSTFNIAPYFGSKKLKRNFSSKSNLFSYAIPRDEIELQNEFNQEKKRIKSIHLLTIGPTSNPIDCSFLDSLDYLDSTESSPTASLRHSIRNSIKNVFKSSMNASNTNRNSIKLKDSLENSSTVSLRSSINTITNSLRKSVTKSQVESPRNEQLKSSKNSLKNSIEALKIPAGVESRKRFSVRMKKAPIQPSLASEIQNELHELNQLQIQLKEQLEKEITAEGDNETKNELEKQLNELKELQKLQKQLQHDIRMGSIAPISAVPFQSPSPLHSSSIPAHFPNQPGHHQLPHPSLNESAPTVSSKTMESDSDTDCSDSEEVKKKKQILLERRKRVEERQNQLAKKREILQKSNSPGTSGGIIISPGGIITSAQAFQSSPLLPTMVSKQPAFDAKQHTERLISSSPTPSEAPIITPYLKVKKPKHQPTVALNLINSPSPSPRENILVIPPTRQPLFFQDTQKWVSPRTANVALSIRNHINDLQAPSQLDNPCLPVSPPLLQSPSAPSSELEGEPIVEREHRSKSSKKKRLTSRKSLGSTKRSTKVSKKESALITEDRKAKYKENKDKPSSRSTGNLLERQKITRKKSVKDEETQKKEKSKKEKTEKVEKADKTEKTEKRRKERRKMKRGYSLENMDSPARKIRRKRTENAENEKERDVMKEPGEEEDEDDLEFLEKRMFEQLAKELAKKKSKKKKKQKKREKPEKTPENKPENEETDSPSQPTHENSLKSSSNEKLKELRERKNYSQGYDALYPARIHATAISEAASRPSSIRMSSAASREAKETKQSPSSPPKSPEKTAEEQKNEAAIIKQLIDARKQVLLLQKQKIEKQRKTRLEKKEILFTEAKIKEENQIKNAIKSKNQKKIEKLETQKKVLENKLKEIKLKSEQKHEEVEKEKHNTEKEKKLEYLKELLKNTFDQLSKEEKEIQINIAAIEKKNEEVLTILYSDGSQYIGNVDEDNNWCGEGRILFADGNVYEGEVFNSKMNGIGSLSFKNGDKYIGQWESNQRHGWGRYQTFFRDVYEGEFRNNLRSGYGIYVTANADRYEGQFQDDRSNGCGVLYYANGDIYQGQFKNDKFHGKGYYRSALGITYEGDYVNGIKEGHGKYTLVNGDVFEGAFKNGKFNGQGVYTFASGETIAGHFLNGRPVQQ